MSARERGRRTKGEGTVYRQPDGKWVGQIDLGFVDGRRRRRSVMGRTKAEAASRMRELLQLQERGVNLAAAADLTLGQWLDEWVSVRKPAEGRRGTTLARYRQVIDATLKPRLGSVRLDRLTPRQVQALLDSLTTQPATVVKVHGVLRAALSDAERLELVHRNVAKAAKPPSLGHRDRRVLTPVEARRLLEHAYGGTYEGVFVIALTMGLRRGEVAGLRWEDVDLEARQLRVRQTIQRLDGRLTVQPTKTYRSNRALRMPALAVDALRRERTVQAAARLKAGPDWFDNGLVFTTHIGTPLEPRNVSRRFVELRREAGVQWARMHDLRHACATFLLAAGVEPRTVMEVLGHSTMRLLDVYGHALPERMDAAAAVVDDVLRSSGSAE